MPNTPGIRAQGPDADAVRHEPESVGSTLSESLRAVRARSRPGESCAQCAGLGADQDFPAEASAHARGPRHVAPTRARQRGSCESRTGNPPRPLVCSEMIARPVSTASLSTKSRSSRSSSHCTFVAGICGQGPLLARCSGTRACGSTSIVVGDGHYPNRAPALSSSQAPAAGSGRE